MFWPKLTLILLLIFLFCTIFPSQCAFNIDSEEIVTDQCDCGHPLIGSCNPQPASRIVGGHKVRSNSSHPWQAFLEICQHNVFRSACFYCGGTLISRRHVVTAQHCLRDAFNRVRKDVKVYLGLREIPEFKPDPSQALEVAEIILHPQYRPGRIENDLAILKLEKVVKLNEFIRTACLPPNNNDDFQGRIALVSGFGDTSFKGKPSEQLLEGYVQILDNEDEICKRSVATGYVPGSKLCAGFPDVDACQGDSGGPLMLDVNGKCTLVGIISYGIDCAKEGFVGVYTRVSVFLDFIRRHVDVEMKNY